MEASSSQQQNEKEPRVHRPCAFDKMEGLVREMQDPEKGVPVRSQKQFLTSIPSAFMGYDLIEWLTDRLSIEGTDSLLYMPSLITYHYRKVAKVEAVHIANQLCQYGYFFPVNDSRTLTVKDDSSLYRFQSPYYWPWQHKTPDNVEYAIYLAKRTLRNRQRHALEDYEVEALNSLRRNLQNKWNMIESQAVEQVRLAKEQRKGDKKISDSQERAFWRVYRPPPGCLSSLEVVPVPTRFRPGLPRPPSRKRTLTDLQREVDLLRNSLTRTRIKVSAAIENLKTYFETYMEYDPMFVQPQPSNPWITEDQTFWQLNSPLVEVPTEKRVKRWALSMEELMSDPTGLQEFTNYLRKEYSHENIRFWLAVKDLRHSFQAQIPEKVNEIFRDFLAPGAPCEINIDGKTMDKVHQEMKNPSRFTFDSAAEHVYTLLLKKDCYPRFIRSDQYRNLLAAGVQPSQKKRFFSFGGQVKKKTTSATPTSGTLQQHGNIGASGTTGRRRGSDRSLTGSAHELAVCGVREISSAPKVPHSHSQTNLTDIPYRGDLARLIKLPTTPNPRSIQDAGAAEASIRHIDDVCPWDAAPGPNAEPGSADGGLPPPTAPSLVTTASVDLPHVYDAAARPSRKNSNQLDSCSSSSDVSLAVTEVTERLRKSYSVQHGPGTAMSTIDRSTSSSFDRATSTTDRSSIGIPFASGMVGRSYSTASAMTCGRVKLSDTSRPYNSSGNYPSPQQSFEHPHILLGERTDTATVESVVPEEEESQAEGSPAKSLEDNEKPPPTKTRAKAPLISISAIVGDLTGDSTVSEKIDVEEIVHGEDDDDTPRREEDPEVANKAREPLPETSDVAKSPSVVPTVHAVLESEETVEEAQVVPVWQPDTPQEGQSAADVTEKPQEKRDNNVNEVCPWEDEENCRVDAPYVKTYATLGYL